MSDSDSTKPLLSDVEANLGPAPEGHSYSQTEHLCARCSDHLDSSRDYTSELLKFTWRLILILTAIFLASTVFSLLVAQMTEGGPSVISIFVVIWTQVTIAVLGLLLYFGRRPQHKLGRIGVQVHILCVLALSWIPLIVGLLATNSRVCWWGGATCGLFTSAHVFVWFLVIVLFGAAYATYRRAVKMHGSALVPLPSPPMVPAWRIASLGGEGGIKI
ncbi:hypothetical protein DFH08DRAFT_895285 [Mycena albidolilacea]|uniref:Uncharacterized protein n=1 Tax=Mycena albidolilacea TaxID=1033008 RepID=A0AAD7EE29_9AGAR|nr:hypothetical protein DFH08DRAFT_895285 [Mycena albidolilacea]